MALVSYERAIARPALAPLERQLAQAISSWAGQGGRTLEEDPRLILAARRSLDDVPHTPGQAFDLELARQRARQLGLTDGELAAVAVRAPPGVDHVSLLLAEVAAEIGRLSVTHLGLAAKRDASGTVVLALFSRRLVHLAPLPTRVSRGGLLSLEGSLLPAASDARSVALAMGLANGRVRQQALPLREGRFTYRLEVGDEPGILDVQLLVDRGLGPEIAAQFPVGIDVEPNARPVARGDGHASDANARPLPADGELESALRNLVLAQRQAANLPLPAVSSQLAEAARAHAVDMRDTGTFAHTSPRYGDLPTRLLSRGVRFQRALEDLAVAASVDEAIAQWLASPSHRANLLDPDVDTFGVGLATLPALTSGGPTRIYAVLILARLGNAAVE